MTQVILLCGEKQSGKSSAGGYIKTLLDTKTRGFTGIYNFADQVKRICRELYDIPYILSYGTDADKETKTIYRWCDILGGGVEYQIRAEYNQLKDFVSVRELMKYVATILRSIDDECFVKSCINQIRSENCHTAIIADCRFKVEIKKVTESFETKKIRLILPNEDKHASESELSTIPLSEFDLVIYKEQQSEAEKNEIIRKFLCL